MEWGLGWFWSVVLSLPVFDIRNCIEFNLCETCEASSYGIHDSSHVFLKIRKPSATLGSEKKHGKSCPLLKRTIYAKDGSLGVRRYCIVCVKGIFYVHYCFLTIFSLELENIPKNVNIGINAMRKIFKSLYIKLPLWS